MTVLIIALAAVVGCVGVLAFASMQNAKARADAQVAKHTEHTKRSEGRHQLNLMDAIGFRRPVTQ